MTLKKICAWCQGEYKRRTRCPECKALLCQFDYMTHKLARANGDGCYFAMLSKAEINFGKQGQQLTNDEYKAALDGNYQ